MAKYAVISKRETRKDTRSEEHTHSNSQKKEEGEKDCKTNLPSIDSSVRNLKYFLLK